jgi:hypothetical protein
MNAGQHVERAEELGETCCEPCVCDNQLKRVQDEVHSYAGNFITSQFGHEQLFTTVLRSNGKSRG